MEHMGAKLIRINDILRSTGKDDWTVRQFILFIRIGETGEAGITLTELEKETGFDQSVVQKACNLMELKGKVSRKTGVRGTKHIDLIEKRNDIDYARRKNVRVTMNGRKVWNKLMEELNA